MAAIRQQGTYLGTTLTGFTAFVAGLYGGGGRGILVAIVGAGICRHIPHLGSTGRRVRRRETQLELQCEEEMSNLLDCSWCSPDG